MVVLYQDGMVGMECLLCDLVGFRALSHFLQGGQGVANEIGASLARIRKTKNERYVLPG